MTDRLSLVPVEFHPAISKEVALELGVKGCLFGCDRLSLCKSISPN